MRRWTIVCLLLITGLLGGCRGDGPRTFVGYTYLVKSYDHEPATFQSEPDRGLLIAGEGFSLTVEPLSKDPQQSLRVLSGRLKPGKELPEMEVVEGTMTIHGPPDGVLQGSLDLKVKSRERAEAKVVGSFVASVQEGSKAESKSAASGSRENE